MSCKAISNQIINRLSTKTDINMEYRDIYSYALEKYISGLVNIIIFAAVALFLRIPLETAVIFIFYAPLRKFAGGIHAKTRLQCTILSAIIMILLVYAAKLCSLSVNWPLIAAAGTVLSIVLVFLFAPVDSEKRRLSRETKVRFKSLSRRIVLLEGVLIILGIFLLPSAKTFILIAVMAILLSGILILPYKKNKEVKKYEKESDE